MLNFGIFKKKKKTAQEERIAKVKARNKEQLKTGKRLKEKRKENNKEEYLKGKKKEGDDMMKKEAKKRAKELGIKL